VLLGHHTAMTAAQWATAQAADPATQLGPVQIEQVMP
jgi:hypothetical protein